MTSFVLAHLTLLHRNCEELVDFAASAGYDGLTLQISPTELTRGPTYPLAPGSAALHALRARVADAGMVVHDIQVIRLGPQFDAQSYEAMLDAGTQLGARYAVVVCDDVERGRVLANLAALAALTRARGLALALEYMVYSAIPTLEHAIGLIDEVGTGSIVPLVDALHHYRSGGCAASLARLPAERVPYIQLCDAPASAPIDPTALRAEALTNRLLPGDGDLPLGEFLAAVPRGIPWAIEVPLKDRRAFASERDMLVAAREQALRIRRCDAA